MSEHNSYDAIVIGGGPAGSSAASILARKGRRVVLFEQEKFPRYHVGESMMPLCYFPLERLGLIEKMKNSAFSVKKCAMQFVSADGKVSESFDFFKHLNHEAAHTWQVIRGEFDKMLLDNARSLGVEVQEETQVKEIVSENGSVVGVRVGGRKGKLREYRAPMTIDCSGREAFSITRNDWRMPDPCIKKAAIWTYIIGAKRDSGLDEASTTVAYIPDKGWIWFNPLPQNMVSVGAVADEDYLFRDTQDLEDIFWREVEENAWIKDRIESGDSFGKYFSTGEYSYRSKHCAMDGLILTGDAFAFLDPIFSSGLFLALKGGVMAGDAVDAALAAGNFKAEQFEAYGQELCQGIEWLRKLVYAFYEANFHFSELFARYPDTRGSVAACLSGDLFKNHDDLFQKVTEFAKVPDPLPYGRPLTAVVA